MEQIDIPIENKDIQAHLSFSRDFNPIHRNPNSARRAALALMCGGKQPNPSLIERLAWGREDFVIAPGGHCAIKAIGAIMSRYELLRDYAPSDVTIRFTTPILVPTGRELMTSLHVENQEEEDGITFTSELRCDPLNSVIGGNQSYQKLSMRFIKRGSKTWEGRSSDRLPNPSGTTLYKSNLIYNHPSLPPPDEDPYLIASKTNREPGIKLSCILGLIPAALINSIGRLKKDPDYTSQFQGLNRRIVEENQLRKETCENYSKHFGIKIDNPESQIYAYCSQDLTFISPAAVEKDKLFTITVTLSPDGISKNTGKHTFLNHGHLVHTEDQMTENQLFFGKSDVISMPAYPRSVIDYAIQRLEADRRAGRGGQLLP